MGPLQRGMPTVLSTILWRIYLRTWSALMGNYTAVDGAGAFPSNLHVRNLHKPCTLLRSISSASMCDCDAMAGWMLSGEGKSNRSCESSSGGVFLQGGARCAYKGRWLSSTQEERGIIHKSRTHCPLPDLLNRANQEARHHHLAFLSPGLLLLSIMSLYFEQLR